MWTFRIATSWSSELYSTPIICRNGYSAATNNARPFPRTKIDKNKGTKVERGQHPEQRVHLLLRYRFVSPGVCLESVLGSQEPGLFSTLRFLR